MSPIVLSLRMIKRIAIDLGGAGKEHSGAVPDGDVEQLTGCLGIDAKCRDRMLLIGRWTGRTRHVKDTVELRQIRKPVQKIVLNKGESGL